MGYEEVRAQVEGENGGGVGMRGLGFLRVEIERGRVCDRKGVEYCKILGNSRILLRKRPEGVKQYSRKVPLAVEDE